MIYDNVNQHIQNILPIYLLNLQDMKLVRRSTVGQYLNHEIAEYIQAHIDGIMKDKDPGLLHRYLTQSPQVLQDLTVETKTWIAQKTAYAIFSHRWLDMGELTFQDISKFESLSVPGFRMLIDHKSSRKILRGTDILDQVNAYSAENPKNRHDRLKLLEVMKELCGDMSDLERRNCQDFVKLVEFFNISLKYGCNYVWFDSGCIDKSSSTELEESIRSMFNWYRNSKICIVHLADTTSFWTVVRDTWFTRGWTLQELLAPKKIKFFGKSWQYITLDSTDNDKDLDFKLKVSLWRVISTLTKIPLRTLLDFTPGINHARDALVWVSKRKTTRVEDIAYCLIGLLGIPFSIAYGEGNMAFRRLQVEILQQSHDMGLFAWTGQPSAYNSMLAEGPQCFSESSLQSHLQPLSMPKSQTVTVFDPTYAFTNYGLRIPLSIYTVHGWEVLHAPSFRFRLWADNLGNIQAQFIVESPPNLEDYDHLKIAILVDLVATEPSASIAILLGYKGGRYKRIPTKEHIIVLSRPTEPTAPEMIFIE